MLRMAMRYVSKTRNGGYQYRRVIPDSWRHVFRKREFVKVIGRTEAEALKAYDQYHNFCQKKFDAMKRLQPPVGSEKQVVRWATTNANLRSLETENVKFSEGTDFSADEDAARGAIADLLLEDHFDGNTGQYTDMPAQQEALIKALYSGMDTATMTIEDAFEFYLARKKKDDPEFAHAQRVRYLRHQGLMVKYLGPNKAIASLVRQDARTVLDMMLEEKGNPSTVRRYMNDIAAVLRFTAREHDIPYRDPFKSLDMPKKTADGGDAKLRDPLPDYVMAEVEKDLEQREDQTLIQLYTLLKYTGARLSEITGLLASEVHLDTDIPYLEIKKRDGRPLKTSWSQRDLPLTQSPRATARARLETIQGAVHLFEKFKGPNGSNLASARLSKAIRKVSKDKKHVIHSLRHNFRDRGRQHLPKDFELRNAIEGRRYSSGEEARYGSWELETFYSAIRQINEED